MQIIYSGRVTLVLQNPLKLLYGKLNYTDIVFKHFVTDGIYFVDRIRGQYIWCMKNTVASR